MSMVSSNRLLPLLAGLVLVLTVVAPALEPIRTHRGVGYALAEDLPAKQPQ